MSVSQYPSVVDRYYQRRYKLDVKGSGNDFCVLCHSNKICLLTLAPTHTIIKDKRTPKSITFQVDKKRNRLDNQASGKGKKGAQMLSETGVVCMITCTDDTTHSVYSCIKGKLVEVNDRLIENVSLLTSKTSTDGYIAIILPNIHDYDKQVANLMSTDEYAKSRSVEQEGTDSTAPEPVTQSEGHENLTCKLDT